MHTDRLTDPCLLVSLCLWECISCMNEQVWLGTVKVEEGKVRQSVNVCVRVKGQKGKQTITTRRRHDLPCLHDKLTSHSLSPPFLDSQRDGWEINGQDEDKRRTVRGERKKREDGRGERQMPVNAYFDCECRQTAGGAAAAAFSLFSSCASCCRQATFEHHEWEH